MMDIEWIEHKGTNIPVHEDEVIEALTGAGRILEGRAGDYLWEPKGSRHDIIAYRVKKEVKE